MSTDKTKEEAPDPKPGLGIVPLVLISSVVALGAGAGGYFLSPTPHATQESTSADDGKKKEKPKAEKSHGGKTAKDGHGEKEGDASDVIGGKWKTIGENAFLELDPLVISISPIGRSKHLKVSIVIETPISEKVALSERMFFVLDTLTIFLRSVEARHLEDPSQMASLREDLRRRIAYAAPGVSIENVLITEFVLT